MPPEETWNACTFEQVWLQRISSALQGQNAKALAKGLERERNHHFGGYLTDSEDECDLPRWDDSDNDA